MQSAKRAGKAFIKISDTSSAQNAFGLPTPFDLTKDPVWNDGGEMYKLFDLDLERRFSLVEVSTCVNACQNSDLDTHTGGQTIDIPREVVVQDGGVNVSMSNTEETTDEILDKSEEDNEHEGRPHTLAVSNIPEITTF